MPTFTPRLLRSIIALLGASLACLLILLVQANFSGSLYYNFLNWNLILAWIPFVLAILAHYFSTSHKSLSPAILLLLFLWFIFYPNAPYIVTDFLHLRGENQFYLIFEIITLFSYSTTGLFLGLASLELAHTVMRKFFGRYLAWLLILTTITAGSFGVYVGRFLRWNSWEIITRPDALIREMAGTIVNPLLYTQLSLAFTFVFSLFCLCLYLLYRTLLKSK